MSPIDWSPVPPRALLTQALWSLAAWLMPVAVVFVLTPPLLQQLGAAGFGVLMLVLLVPTMAVLCDFGLGATAVRELAMTLERRDGRVSLLLRHFAIALIAAGALVGTALWLAAPRLTTALGLAGTEGSDRLLRHCAAWAALAIALQPPALLARAMQRLKLLAAVQTTAVAALWLGAWWLTRDGRVAVDVTWLGMALTASAALALLLILRPSIAAPALAGAAGVTGVTAAAPPPAAAERLRFASGIFGTQVASVLVFQADRYLVAALAGAAVAGAYAALINLANKLVAVIGGLTAFLFPHFAGLFGTARTDDIRAAVNASERIALLLVAPTVMPALLLAGPFLDLWLGDQARAGWTPALQLLYCGFAISALGAPIGQAVFGRGDSRFAAMFAWLTAGTLLIAMPLLAPRYGLTGAAAATALALSTSLVFQIAGRRRLAIARDAGTGALMLGMLAGCAVQALIGAMLRPWATGWLLLLLIALLIWSAFFAARLLLGRLSPEERLLLSILKRQRPH